MAEVDFLLKAARAYVQADIHAENLKLRSNDRANLEGALRCYQQALLNFEEDSVMRAAIIREIKKIHPISDMTSGFVSSSHRIYDLELSSNESIQIGDFVAALDKRTEIFDDIIERKVQHFYVDVMTR